MLLIVHHTGEPYGLLGPQMAATYISRRLSIPTFVLGVKRQFSEGEFFKFLKEHYIDKEKIVLFSYHCGRPDIIRIAETLKKMGYRTVLGGPQTQKDMPGEGKLKGQKYRFEGLSGIFDLGYSGPVDGISEEILFNENGLLQEEWERELSFQIDWDNIFVFGDKPEKIEVLTAQVLRSIGCPYAKKKSKVAIDPPSFFPQLGPLEIEAEGCSFCDIAWDKGYKGTISDEKVLEQIENLPVVGGKKIPFELIDEYPIGFLPRLIELATSRGIELSQINLVLRADDILRKREVLEKSLSEMKRIGTKLLLSSIGFESFSNRILKNLNKGLTVSENLEAVSIIRELKRRFPDVLFYSRDEGSVHGFIHPTPWDDNETESEIRATIGAYELFRDILPFHSTPLIIHHACALGEWARRIEEKMGISFSRRVNIIEWWNYEKW